MWDRTPAPGPAPERWDDHPDRGWISDYNEQGMESFFLIVFEPADTARSRNDGSAPKGLDELRPGDVLTVWDADGTVLLHDRLTIRRDGWFGPRHVAPPARSGIDVETWLQWLRRRPKLRAVRMRS
ncbi:MAG: hypothetical protein H6737_24580 [Alphaproteobacteria bacterium]|nr:hypothetical protein [Alphaproteobacteria bacterium]